MQRSRDSSSLEYKQYYYPLAGKVFLVDLPVGEEEWLFLRQQICMLGGIVEETAHSPSISHVVAEPLAVPPSSLVVWAEVHGKTIYPLARFRLFLKSRCTDLRVSGSHPARVQVDQGPNFTRNMISPRKEIYPPLLCGMRNGNECTSAAQTIITPTNPQIILRDLVKEKSEGKGSSGKGSYVKEFVPDEKNQSTVPCLRVDSPSGYTPFLPLLDCQRISRFLTRVESSSTSGSLLEKRKKPDYPNSLKTRAGYCENCGVHFQSYSQHVQTQKHKQYEDNNDHFAELDALLPDL